MLVNSLVGQNLADDTVALPSGLQFDTSRSSAPCYSGIRFNTDGNIEKMTAAGAWQQAGVWLLKGTASNYYIQRTIDSGTLDTDDGDGVQMTTNRQYYLTDSSAATSETAQLTFEISTDAPGSTVKAGPRTYTLEADYEPPV